MARCPATDTITVDGQPLKLQCIHWGAPDDPDDRHRGDHLVHTPPAMGDDHTWPNLNPLPDEDPPTSE